MDRRERWAEPVEALRAALDGRQAEMWTALPGIVQSFDPAAMTVSVQPAVAGRISDEAGKAASVDLPILPDVPVVFPGGGGFALTFPVAAGDECLVVFASRCIDAWWQSGGVGEPMEPRMHDLSDGFALVGVRSQPHRLSPAVHTGNTQLRADDGSAYVEITPGGAVTAVGPSSVTRPATAGCTVTVMATGSKDWMIPGSAVHISACLPSRAARCASTGSSCRSRLSIIAGPKEDAWCRQCRCRRDRRTSRCRACRP